ncbi:MAG: lysophospholipid acyltransferase family protein [Candidatus Omnitrophota bacterium]|nr:lysophospholipid acyltransferase family protein [Candidatus Omnitrophota bacterium]MBU1894601.1 lysophospholipid acyltransferase family protein [Candidatus Omnitrophota bacterium]
MLYYLYVIGILLAKLMPLNVCYNFAKWVSGIYCRFAGEDKKELRENFKVVLGESTSEDILDKNIRRVFINFAKYLADFFKIPRITKDFIAQKVTIYGREYLDEGLREGKGVVLVSLHLGNWEMGGAVISMSGYPVKAIALEHSNKRINNFFKNRRFINGIQAIPVGSQIKECFKVLKNNEVLAIVGDKDYTSNGIPVDFFGKKAIMPKGPAVFALRTGAPIVCSVLFREDGDNFILSFEKPIKYKKTGDYNNDLLAVMGQYLKVFEKFIKEKPDQWYAFRRIWKQ